MRDRRKGSRGNRGQQGRPMPIVRSVERAARMMQALVYAPHGMRVAELSQELGLHKTTVVRLLRTLMALGAVRKDEESEHYAWDPLTLMGVICAARGALSAADITRAALERLAEESGETAYMGRLAARQREARTIAVAHPKGGESVHLCVGDCFPAHGSATGKVCLCWMSSVDLEGWLKPGLERVTRHTIASRQELQRELERCRRQGYAVNREETTLGLGAVAVPVRDEKERVVGAVAVTMTVAKMTRRRVEGWVRLLKETAATISPVVYTLFRGEGLGGPEKVS